MRVTERFQRSFFFHIKAQYIPLFWHDCGGVKNFGDELNPFIVKSLTGKKIKRVKYIPRRLANSNVNLCIGSIISGANKNCNVWGSGIINSNSNLSHSNFYAVRGPRTQNRMKQLGITPPTTVGDPALLTPLFYDNPQKKQYEFGIVPHYTELDILKLQTFPNWVSVIDVTLPIFQVIDEIRKCKTILSSSLHGIIISHAYNIKATWIKISSDRIIGDNIKYYDYLESINVKDFNSYSLNNRYNIDKIINELKFPTPSDEVIYQIQKKLIDCNPF